MLGLPDTTTGCLFDMDGVLTETLDLHREAWSDTFNGFLHRHYGPGCPAFTDSDYFAHVDGRSRIDGVQDFLRSRDIDLPEGDPDDEPGTATVHALANEKNALLSRLLGERGAKVYPGSLRYLEAVRTHGLGIGVITSSSNAAKVLDGAGLNHFVSIRVDGITIERENLRGKPAPDAFLAGASALGVDPADTAVFEDAQSGVRAAAAGGFGYVVGVDRATNAEQLRTNGADVVVHDLAELLEDTR